MQELVDDQELSVDFGKVIAGIKMGKVTKKEVMADLVDQVQEVVGLIGRRERNSETT